MNYKKRGWLTAIYSLFLIFSSTTVLAAPAINIASPLKNILGPLFEFFGGALGLRLLLWLAVFAIIYGVLDKFGGGAFEGRIAGTIGFIIATVSAATVSEELILSAGRLYGGLAAIIMVLAPALILLYFSLENRSARGMKAALLTVVWLMYLFALMSMVGGSLTPELPDWARTSVQLILLLSGGIAVYYGIRIFNSSGFTGLNSASDDFDNNDEAANQRAERKEARELDKETNQLENKIDEMSSKVEQLEESKNKEERRRKLSEIQSSGEAIRAEILDNYKEHLNQLKDFEEGEYVTLKNKLDKLNKAAKEYNERLAEKEAEGKIKGASKKSMQENLGELKSLIKEGEMLLEDTEGELKEAKEAEDIFNSIKEFYKGLIETVRSGALDESKHNLQQMKELAQELDEKINNVKALIRKERKDGIRKWSKQVKNTLESIEKL